MIIRKPTPRDVPLIRHAFYAVAGFFGLTEKEVTEVSINYLHSFIMDCVDTECSFIAIVDGEIKGWSFSTIVSPWFSPNVKILHTHTIFVHEDYRGTLMGGRLFLAHDKQATLMLESGRVSAVNMTKRPDGSNFNLESRGYIASDTTFTRNL